MPPSEEHRPRAMVVDRAWRALGPGLESLSGPGGAPLTRTVKLIVTPLVLRPSLRPDLAAEVLGPDEASRLEALIADAGPRLAATAGWFSVLKKTRRALGIVGGSPQDLYFQLCFELATEHGAPGADAAELAKDALTELADAAGGRTVEALKDHLRDPAQYARLEGDLATAWARRELTPIGGEDTALRLATEVLDDLSSSAFAVLVSERHGSVVGRSLWTHTRGFWGTAELPPHLGLTTYPVPSRPEVGRSASTSALPAPFDRTLYERVFVELQTSSARREGLPDVPELVQGEVGRSCAPFGLSDETLRAAMVVGGRLATGLNPLGDKDFEAQTIAHRAVNRRWQREASALRARRMTTSPDPGGGPLAALADDLRAPWSAYMRRLWVRLHGRDVRSAPLTDAASAWEVLDGVVRSVMMDHRAKVRTALRALSSSDTAELRSA